MNELDLFAAAIAIVDAGERAVLLDRECAGRPDVRQRIDQLLDAHFQSHPLLDQPAPERTGAYVPNEEPGVVVAGRYKLLEQIGEGGMGTVWVAEQSQPVRRKVALKLIKAGMDSKSVIARFEAERQALAVMDHPNVAKVLDGGLTETGRPFFVMEYVKGVPITEYCDAARLSVPERLQLFTQVCQAVQHAHQKGIIHRDLKPSNILVAPYDDKPVPKIIDFGLAKAMHQSLTEKTLHTAHETVLGTPLYMSPEQAQLNNLDVDTRSDIYSLGVLLYELLTGTTPLEKQRFKEAAWDEIKRIIREEDPPRPSTRLSSTSTLPSLAACRQTEPLRLTKQVRGELDWIVMKALEKDRSRRYETATGFAADVQRYLAGEPVLAAPPSATYRLKKFVRRRRGPLVAASVVVLALLVGAATVIAVQVRANRELAVKNRELADQQAKLEARNRELAEEQAKVLARETQAINAVRRFGDVVSKNQALKNNPALESLRKELLKEPLEFFRDLRTRLQADRDTNPESLERLAKASHDLSTLTTEIGDLQVALIACRETLAIDQKLADANPDVARFRNNLAASHTQVGDLLSETGKPAEAEAEFRRAIALRQKLADDFPDVAEYRSSLAGSRHDLANVLAATGRPAEAEAEFRKAIALSQRVTDENPATPFRQFLANHHHNLGVLLRETGQSPKAEGEHRAALAIYRKLADEQPGNVEFRVSLADSHLALANLTSMAGNPVEAVAEIRKALAIYQKLADDNPSVTQFRSRVALGHFNLVGNLNAAGKTAEAETEYQLVLGMYQKLADDHPSITEFRKYLAQTHKNLAILRKNTGSLAGAEVEFRAALSILRKLADDNPTVTEFRSALAGSHHGLGDVLTATGKTTAAEAEYRKAIALSQKATDENPAAAQFRQFLANHHLNFGILLQGTGRPAEAEAEYRKAQAIYRKLVDAEPEVIHNTIALALIHENLGRLMLEMCRPTEAAADFRQALKLNPNSVQAKMGLTQAERLTALLDKLPALLKGDYKPTSNGERLAFAEVCITKKRHRAAAGLYADAFAADPKLADNPTTEHRYFAACCASLAAGPGEEDAILDDRERVRLRKKALDWLRADLSLHARQLESGPPAAHAAVARHMKHWQQDPDLAGIRDADALARLPADEQKSFTHLWADVADLLKKAETK